MTDPNTAMPTPAALPAALSEMDKLKLQLAKERARAVQAETMNLQMAQRSLEAQFKAVDAENKALFEKLKADYSLAPQDEIGEDGSIKRSNVRSIPAPPKEG